MKKILDVLTAPTSHWVGNGFPVRSLFSYSIPNLPLSPFLLLDYAGPQTFPGDGRQRGVGQHPHRGFETVTIVYSGEVEHKDSTGAGGIIGPGDVQWMTAGDGILHEEFHSEAFAQRGGELEMVQLWVNLPAKNKRAKAGYQAIVDSDIPVRDLPNQAGRLRLIAGDYNGQKGAANTFSPVDVWDLRMNAGGQAELPAAAGRNLMLVVLGGEVRLNGERDLSAAQMAVFDTLGEGISIEGQSDAKLLLLGGEPLNEPVVGYGPFVMNSQAEIRVAIDDFNHGRFARAS
ncbi:MAG: pirin family protein [Oceanococcus sp.]